MSDTLVIASRFCGPPGSGNGGYVSGLLAGFFSEAHGPVEVTLQRPPPLERPLCVERATGEDSLRLLDADAVVAEARPRALAIEPPPAPSFAAACEYAKRYAGFVSHTFPGCFTCGPARAEGDGLRIFPGRSPDGSLVAAPFSPSASHGDAEGVLQTAIAWAALDCSGYFACVHPEPALLGRMCAEVRQPLSASARYVVVGWSLGRDGRKAHAATALYDEAGHAVGRAKQTWITVR